MNAVILEDEPLVARNLLKLLEDCAPEITVLATLESVSAATAWFGAHPEPEIIFADIQLSDGVSFDLFSAVQPQCPIIFTTAYDEYAIRAFKLNSIDYLLKPVDRDELRQALEKLYRQTASARNAGDGRSADGQPSVSAAQLQQVLASLTHSPEKSIYKNRLMASRHGGLAPVAVERVAYIVKEKVIYIVTLDGEKHIAEEDSMEVLEACLHPATFFRANRQYIVSIHAVSDLRSTYNGKADLHLHDALMTDISISREKVAELKAWLSA